MSKWLLNRAEEKWSHLRLIHVFPFFLISKTVQYSQVKGRKRQNNIQCTKIKRICIDFAYLCMGPHSEVESSYPPHFWNWCQFWYSSIKNMIWIHSFSILSWNKHLCIHAWICTHTQCNIYLAVKLHWLQQCINLSDTNLNTFKWYQFKYINFLKKIDLNKFLWCRQ